MARTRRRRPVSPTVGDRRLFAQERCLTGTSTCTPVPGRVRAVMTLILPARRDRRRSRGAGVGTVGGGAHGPAPPQAVYRPVRTRSRRRSERNYSVVTAAVMGAGSFGTAYAKVLRDAGTDVTMWARRPEVAEAISQTGENPAYLPGLRLPDGLSATTDAAAAL